MKKKKIKKRRKLKDVRYKIVILYKNKFSKNHTDKTICK